MRPPEGYVKKGKKITEVHAQATSKHEHYNYQINCRRSLVWFPDPSCMGGARERREGTKLARHCSHFHRTLACHPYILSFQQVYNHLSNLSHCSIVIMTWPPYHIYTS